MARQTNIERMSYGDLIALRDQVDALIARKQGEEKAALKQKLSDIAKAKGFELNDILGNGARRGKGSVAIKYRDPKDPSNTWTGRGRMPRWLTAATKARGVTKEDFLI